MNFPQSLASAAAYSDALISLIKEYGFIYEHHAVDFFIKDYWNSVFPQEWKVMENADLADLIALASQGIGKGMSSKKEHEVARLSALINSIAESEKIDRILDIGAGQGYLDIVLAFQYDKLVIGVDDAEIQTCGAKRRTDLANKAVFKDTVPRGELYHINRRVHANEPFSGLVAEAVGASQGEECSVDSTTDGRWLLGGLHACGDLTPAIMKHFLESDAAALVCVGCCYNMISERRPGSDQTMETEGFPLSKHLKSQSVHLGFSARMLACQATCRWAEEVGDTFVRHHFRALLQFVLHENGLMDRARANSKSSTDHDIIVGRMKAAAFDKGFAFYARLALSRLQIDAEAEGLFKAKLQAYEERFKSREKEIAIVWTLRSMMGSVFESLLLVDRYLFLAEQKQACGLDRMEVVALFDPVVSPRNMVLVATKKK
ncbi:Methyltransferase-like protein 25 [Podochytrium sp. JEL0797]|nr:Methyltransferase-like protein 25 [Podochytrium sp. JEL0797]